MMAAAGKMVMQMTLAPGTEGAVKKMVMQLGAGDPMDMPVEMSGGKPFTKPNPKTLRRVGDDQGRRGIVQDEALSRQDAAGRQDRLLGQRERAAVRAS